jgi:hypothetical protein
LPNPKLAPHGSSPTWRVVVNAPVTSICGVGVAASRTLPMSRRSRRSNGWASGTYADRLACAFCTARCVASSRTRAVSGLVYGVLVSTL